MDGMDINASWRCVLHSLKITSRILKFMHTSKFESFTWHYNVSSVDVYISQRLTDVHSSISIRWKLTACLQSYKWQAN